MRGSGTGGARVNVTVKTDVKKLKSLNRIIRTACDVELPWEDFFRKHSKVVVDPKRYKVAAFRKEAVFLAQKVRDLIGQFDNIRAVYIVQVIRIRSQQAEKKKAARCRGRPRKTVAAIPPTLENQEQGSQTEIPRSATPQKASSSVHHRPSSSNAAADPTGHPDRPIRSCPDLPNPTIKVSRSPMNDKSPPIQSPTPTILHFPGLGLATPRASGHHGPQRPDFLQTRVNEDDDDNASHFSTTSQAFRHDLVNLGIPNEEIKFKVMKKLGMNISNEMLLVARNELKKFAGTRHWMRLSHHNPVACSILTHILMTN